MIESVLERIPSSVLEVWKEINPELEKSLDTLFTEHRKKNSTTPKGYICTGTSSEPIPELLAEFVVSLSQQRYESSRSLRECLDQLQPMLQKYDTTLAGVPGTSNVFDRIETGLGLIAPKMTAKDRIKLREQTRKANGETRAYNRTHKDQKVMDKQKKLTATNNEIKEAKEKIVRLQKKAAMNAAKLKLQGDPTKHGIEASPTSSKKPKEKESNLIVTNSRTYEMPETDREVIFSPTPKQAEFMAASEDIVLYGGAAGGGKSYALLFDVLRYAHKAGYRALIIRRTSNELRELIDIAREKYPKLFPGAKYQTQEKVFRFPSGAIIEFGYMDAEKDVYQYQGKQYQYIGIDELGLQATPYGFDYLRSRLRSTNPEIKKYFRCTANPGSIWVKEFFIDSAPENTAFTLPGSVTEKKPKGITCRFIPSRLKDNPYLFDDGEYEAMLMSLGEIERRQLLEGDWTASSDNAFPEFNPIEHVVTDYWLPPHWNRVCGLDYGYRDASAAVWFAINPDDGTAIVYRELLQKGMTGEEFAKKVLEMEKDERVPVDHIVDWSVYAQTGHTGPTIAEAMYKAGLRMRRADKNRSAGFVQVQSRLRKDIKTGMPKLRFFSSCIETIRQIQGAKQSRKEGNFEDIDQIRDKRGHWDLYDALRYGLMSRPNIETSEQRFNAIKRRTWNPIDPVFGY